MLGFGSRGLAPLVDDTRLSSDGITEAEAAVYGLLFVVVKLTVRFGPIKQAAGLVACMSLWQSTGSSNECINVCRHTCCKVQSIGTGMANWPVNIICQLREV